MKRVDRKDEYASVRVYASGRAAQAARMDAQDLKKLGDVAKLIQSGLISEADHATAVALVSEVRATATKQFGTAFELTPAFVALRDAFGRDPSPEIEALHASLAALENSLRTAPDDDTATRRRTVIDHVVDNWLLLSACTGMAGALLAQLVS